MTNTNITKKALLSSVLALVVCFSLLLGTTLAWFTDSATSADNKIQAGTLDVQLLVWDASTGDYVDISTSEQAIFGGAEALVAPGTIWEPNKTEVAYFCIKNAGTLDLKYQVALEVTDVTNNLTDVMEYAITRDATPAEPVTAWNEAAGVGVHPGLNATEATAVTLGAGAEHYFALSVHMLKEAGNQYQNGTITFDLKVLAAQLASEEDAFGSDYDAGALFPVLAYGAAAVTGADLTIDLKNPDGGKQGSVIIPAEAIGAETEEVYATIFEQAVADASVVVAADQGAKTYDVTVNGLKSGNTEEVKFTINVGKGLTGVKLYHNDELMPSTKYSYNANTGVITALSASFSPFTVVFDAVEADVELDPTLPVANVTDVSVDYLNADGTTDLVWDGFGPFNALDPEYQLEGVFLFKDANLGNADWIASTEYANWNCDFFVSCDRQVGAESILLGGNYGEWGWVGFTNGEEVIEANTEIALLELAGGTWTYEMVYDFVGEFLCGVAHLNDSLNGATFTVELRLTNPTDASDIREIAVINFTFDNTPVVVD